MENSHFLLFWLVPCNNYQSLARMLYFLSTNCLSMCISQLHPRSKRSSIFYNLSNQPCHVDFISLMHIILSL